MNYVGMDYHKKYSHATAVNEQGMLRSIPNSLRKSKKMAEYFSDSSNEHKHQSHGRRIDRTEARKQWVTIDDLEEDQELQDAVLTAYHVLTIGFEKTSATKALISHQGMRWIKAAAEQ